MPAEWYGAEELSPVVLANDGSGGFVEATAPVFGGLPSKIQNPSEIVVAEFNGDGRPDLFVAEGGLDKWPWPGGQNILILSAPTGKLVDATGNLPQQTDCTHAADATDIDGDGDGVLDEFSGSWDFSLSLQVGGCVLFDEAHEEANTLSWERAQSIEPAHPDWVYFGDAAVCCLRRPRLAC